MTATPQGSDARAAQVATWRPCVECVEKRAAASGTEWLVPTRRRAFERFAELGFPTARDEAWKYTNVAPIRSGRFSCVTEAPEVDIERLDIDDNDPLRAGCADPLDAVALGSECCSHLVFVDGRFAERLSTGITVDKIGERCCPEVTIEPLCTALRNRRELIEPHLARVASFDEQPFVALNTALAEDGVFIHVPRGRAAGGVIHLVFAASGREPAIAFHPRILIVLEEGAQATVVEEYLGLGDGPSLTNVVTEAVVAENAKLDHYKLERENEAAYHISSLATHLERSSVFASHSFSFGGALVRNDASAVLDGEGIECTLNGLTVAAGEQHVDNHTHIVHAKPHCDSHELYKAVLADRARGVFNGKIYVAQDAQQTDAKQTNKSLLLSDSARMDAKPELEIYADDVKCTHGATIGQLEDSAMFYLRSRGIDRDSARDLLTYAFASDVVERVQVKALFAAIEKLLFERLPRSELAPTA